MVLSYEFLLLQLIPYALENTGCMYVCLQLPKSQTVWQTFCYMLVWEKSIAEFSRKTKDKLPDSTVNI